MSAHKHKKKKKKKQKELELASHSLPTSALHCNFRAQNVESWPATTTVTPRLSTNKSVAFLKSRSLARNPHSVLSNLLTNINASNKPLLLIEMEEFIHYELALPHNRHRDADPNAINESRIEVFDRVFDLFISEFKTYQPVLLQIKREYEDVLARCLRKMHSVRALERKMSTLERDHKDALAALDVAHSEALARKDAQIAALQTRVDEINAVHSDTDALLAQSAAEQRRLKAIAVDAQRSSQTFYGEVKKLQQSAVSAERAKASQCAEVRKLEMANRALSTSYESVVADLKRCQDEVDRAAVAEASQDEAKERDKKMRYLGDKVAEYKELYASLMADHQNLLDLYDSAAKERSDATEQFAALMSSSVGDERPVTPRPNWAKAVELNLVDAAAVTGKSTGDIMATLTTTLKQLEEKVEMLQGLVPDEKLREMAHRDESMFLDVDYDAATPKYLRYRGTIRKRRMAKRDCERMLHAIWKRKYAKATTREMELAEFLNEYLKTEFGIQSRVVETGYALLGALDRYGYDADCELFATILRGELSEDVYRDQVRFLDELMTRFVLADKHKKGELAKEHIERIVRKLCAAKSEQNMKKLLNALELNEPQPKVRYELLFKEDRDGNQGPFVEELRDQHLSEIQLFHAEISEQLKAVQNEYQQVTVQQIEETLQRLDPQKTQTEIDRYLCVGFGVSMRKSLASDLLVSLDTFTAKLATILVKRTGPNSIASSSSASPAPSFIF